MREARRTAVNDDVYGTTRCTHCGVVVAEEVTQHEKLRRKRRARPQIETKRARARANVEPTLGHINGSTEMLRLISRDMRDAGAWTPQQNGI